MNFSLKIILFIIALIGLLVFQSEIVKPLVLKVVKSDLFLTDSKDLGDAHTISNEMTDFANMHCSHYIYEELGADSKPIFADKPINAWDIGNNTYVINSKVEFLDDEGKTHNKTYVCRISYEEKTDPTNYDNWSVYGVSGID